MAAHYSLLPARGALAVSGEESRGFLQGLISNDVAKVAADRAIYAALLTPQGKYLHDFFISVRPDGEGLVIDCEAARQADLQRRLTMYRLRAKVAFADLSTERAVAALFGEDALATLDLAAEPGLARPLGEGLVYVDPRLAAAGARAVLPAATAAASLEAGGFVAAEGAAYDDWRLGLGLPDGSRDIGVEKQLLLECGFNELHGIDYDKGCYIGQELTARTHYRAKIRKRLVPVEVDGPLPAPGTAIESSDGPAGEIRSGRDGRAIALLKLDKLNTTLRAGTVGITPKPANWMEL